MELFCNEKISRSPNQKPKKKREDVNLFREQNINQTFFAISRSPNQKPKKKRENVNLFREQNINQTFFAMCSSHISHLA